MTDLVMGKRLRCELNGEKTHDRFVGVCYLDGKDIGATVIANGLALDCPRMRTRLSLPTGRTIYAAQSCCHSISAASRFVL